VDNCLQSTFIYVSLSAVSDNKITCKLLKTLHLKFYFNFKQLSHKPVEKPVENFYIEALSGAKRA
jgi:hypothetical protein